MSSHGGGSKSWEDQRSIRSFVLSNMLSLCTLYNSTDRGGLNHWRGSDRLVRRLARGFPLCFWECSDVCLLTALFFLVVMQHDSRSQEDLTSQINRRETV